MCLFINDVTRPCDLLAIPIKCKQCAKCGDVLTKISNYAINWRGWAAAVQCGERWTARTAREMNTINSWKTFCEHFRMQFQNVPKIIGSRNFIANLMMSGFDSSILLGATFHLISELADWTHSIVSLQRVTVFDSWNFVFPAAPGTSQFAIKVLETFT